MFQEARLIPEKTPLVILSEGCFGEVTSKTALGVIRYGQWPIAAILDSTRAGRTVRQVTGLDCDAPVVASLQDALALKPKALLLGTAPGGGKLPEGWRPILKEAIRNGLHIINGLHYFLNDDLELKELAGEAGVQLWDVRDPEHYGPSRFKAINLQKPRPANVRVVTMVGTDCAIGKMVTALELDLGMRRRNRPSGFVATGQTGIMISGSGVPLDRVIADFMAGSLETCIQDAIQELKVNTGDSWLFIEGQGSLTHPAYSGVTLGLLHGSNPDALILCHKAGTTSIRNYEHLPIPPFREVIQLNEQAAAWVRAPKQPKASVVGISINTMNLSDDEARAYIAKVQDETGLPTTDPVRYGVDQLLSNLENVFSPEPIV